MNQTLTKTTIESAIEDLKAGKGVIVVDNEDRENEGDLIFPAETITDEQMATLIRPLELAKISLIVIHARMELITLSIVKIRNLSFLLKH